VDTWKTGIIKIYNKIVENYEEETRRKLDAPENDTC